MPQNLPDRKKNSTVPDRTEFSWTQVGVSLGGGLAAAAVFAVLTKGTLAGLMLAHLAPLPIIIVALGFGLRHGATSAIIATGLLSIWPHPFFGFAYAFLIALPAMLAAFIASGAPYRKRDTVTRHLPAWATLGVAFAVAAAISAGTGAAAFHFGSLEEALNPLRARAFLLIEDMIRSQDMGDRLDAKQLSGIVYFFPGMLAAYLLLLHMLNLWIAGRLAKASGLLARRWPDVANEFVLPRGVAAAFAIFAVFGFVDGLAGEIGLIVAMTLGLALALQGFAVAHALLRGAKTSAIVLTLAYFIVGLFVWPIIFFTALGAADAAFSFRTRKAAAQEKRS